MEMDKRRWSYRLVIIWKEIPWFFHTVSFKMSYIWLLMPWTTLLGNCFFPWQKLPICLTDMGSILLPFPEIINKSSFSWLISNLSKVYSILLYKFSRPSLEWLHKKKNYQINCHKTWRLSMVTQKHADSTVSFAKKNGIVRSQQQNLWSYHISFVAPIANNRFILTVDSKN